MDTECTDLSQVFAKFQVKLNSWKIFDKLFIDKFEKNLENCLKKWNQYPKNNNWNYLTVKIFLGLIRSIVLTTCCRSFHRPLFVRPPLFFSVRDGLTRDYCRRRLVGAVVYRSPLSECLARSLPLSSSIPCKWRINSSAMFKCLWRRFQHPSYFGSGLHENFSAFKNFMRPIATDWTKFL